MIYLVYHKNRIIGRFKSHEKALDYLLDCYFDGLENLSIKNLTLEEYENLKKKNLKRG